MGVREWGGWVRAKDAKDAKVRKGDYRDVPFSYEQTIDLSLYTF